MQVLGACMGRHPDIPVLPDTLLQALSDLQHYRWAQGFMLAVYVLSVLL